MFDTGKASIRVQLTLQVCNTILKDHSTDSNASIQVTRIIKVADRSTEKLERGTDDIVQI